MSLVQLPWKQDELFGGFATADVMSRDRFLKLTRCLHVANNGEVDMTFKLFKIRKMHVVVKDKCLENYHPSMNFAIDEAMLKYCGGGGGGRGVML